jgi:hypothetical protein
VIKDARDRRKRVIGWVALTQDGILPCCAESGARNPLSTQGYSSSRIRLSFGYLCANWGQFAAPGPFLLELSRQAK